jgi:hypothetical protein
MTITTSGTSITFNDATVQTTAYTGGGVTSLNGSTGALNGMTYISSGSFGSTAVSNNYITGLPSGYNFFKVFATFKFNGVDGNGGGLALRLSKDNGSTYYTSSYAVGTVISNAGSGADAGQGSSGYSQSRIFMTYTPGGSSGTWVTLDMTILNAQGTTTVPPSVIGTAGTTSNGGDNCQIGNFVGGNSNISAGQYINALQFFIDNGSSKQMNGGYYYVYGMK